MQKQWRPSAAILKKKKKWHLPDWPQQSRKFTGFMVLWLFLSQVGASLISQLVKNLPAMHEPLVWFLGWEDALEKGMATHSVFLGFPCGSAGKESTCNAGDLGSIPELGRTPGEGKGYPLQYSGLENSIVHGVTKRDDLAQHSMAHCIQCLIITYNQN